MIQCLSYERYQIIGEVLLAAVEVLQMLVCLRFAKCRKQEALQQSMTNGGTAGELQAYLE